MNELNLPILSSVKADNINAFIEYWSKLYSYREELEKKYTKNIILEQYSPDDIRELFEWKNGSKLSDAKFNGFENNVLLNLDTINRFKSTEDFNVEEFKVKFNSYKGVVWRIFLLHTIKPNEFPIYDQHIHRAYNYVNNIPFDKITNTMDGEEKWQFYFSKYLPFINSIRNSHLKKWELKKIDEAFFAFGKLLNTGGYQRTII